jgi:hypothetical protein
MQLLAFEMRLLAVKSAILLCQERIVSAQGTRDSSAVALTAVRTSETGAVRVAGPGTPAVFFLKSRIFNSDNYHKIHKIVYSVSIACGSLLDELCVKGDTMIHKTRLYTPGPTPLLPAAQFAMAAADMHHRTAEFRALFQKVLAQLKVFVGTRNDVLLLACSGTGAMEASVSNLTSPADKVLVLTAGKFGERWTGLAKAFGCVPEVVTAPYGQTFDLAQVRSALRREHKVIYVQATETSTAVKHDVQAIAKIRDEVAPETLLVVDGMGWARRRLTWTDGESTC